MKRFLLISLLCVIAFAGIVLAQVPKRISFQGLLTSSSGAPAANGSYDLQFGIHDSASGGASLWAEPHAGVSVQQGTFSVILGSLTSLNLPFDKRYFVEVTATAGPGIGSPITFSPRAELTSSPYALRADTAEYAKAAPGGGGGPYLPLAGGTMTGAITNTGNPSITMGKGNFGTGNTNSGNNSFVAGEQNIASGNRSTVGGGFSNSASGDSSVVGGGSGNVSSWKAATVAGGSRNTASDAYATVGGGHNNQANANSATVGGGAVNTASQNASTVSGGSFNTANAQSAVVGGGTSNIASGDYSTVGGGVLNRARGLASTVAGGGGAFAPDSNSALGSYSSVPGGRANKAAGNYSLAAGWRAKVNHTGTFVWADSTGASGTDFTSTGTNQFLIRASGGVGIGTASPAQQLDVAGTTQMTGFKMPPGAGSGLVLTSDATGVGTWQSVGSSGWVDDGTVVRLGASTDQVGIGTVSPTKALEVSGSAKVTDTLFASNVSSTSPLRLQTAGTTRMYVDDASGNVGIGTVTPTGKLHVREGSQPWDIVVEHDSSVNSDALLIKRPGVESPTNIRFSLSERLSNTDLWLYGYDGTTFKNFIGFSYPMNIISFPADGSLFTIHNLPGRVGIATPFPNSVLHVSGAISTQVTAVSSNITLTQSHSVVLVSASGGAVTITLPSAVGIAGRQYVIKKDDVTANTVTVDPAGTETIEGVATASLPSQWHWIVIISDGTNWITIAGKYS